MALATVDTPPSDARPLRSHEQARPEVIEVERQELVGVFMDLQTLVRDVWKALNANAYGLQTAMRLPPGPWRQELQFAHHDTHEALRALLMEFRAAAFRYDIEIEGLEPTTD